MKHVSVPLGAALLGAVAILAIFAPWIAPFDPIEINPIHRLRPPGGDYLFGTDAFGRDVFSRTIHGGRVSLLVGLAVAAFATAVGLVIGLAAGFITAVDRVVMRIMDGLMAIPGILLAIAMMSLTRASVVTVIIAITVPEVPRVVRLVRAVVLTVRAQPFVEAAIAGGARLPRLLGRHVLPNIVGPVIVQATFISASAVLVEAYLSFLGAGTPSEIPSWGNIMAAGRNVLQLAFWTIAFPGVFLAAMVLGINLLGDGLRDRLDPRLARAVR